MTQSYETQIYTKTGSVAKIEFNRPHVRNATNPQFYLDLTTCLDRAEADKEVRSIVLAAAGTVFCAGQDLTFSANCTHDEWTDYVKVLRHAQDRIRRNAKPVIARVHGDALGGGTYIVSACDLVVIKKSARLALREIQAGETSGGALLFAVGKQRASEINLLGRFISGEEADRWNLVNKAVDSEDQLDEQVSDWTEQLSKLPPLGLKQTKIASNFLLDLAGYDLHRAASFSAPLQYTKDRAEAKRAWVEKRSPVFIGE